MVCWPVTPHLLSPKQINFISWVLLNLHHHHSPCTSNSMYYYLEIFSELAKRWPTSRLGKKSAMTRLLPGDKKLATTNAWENLPGGNCLKAVYEHLCTASTSLVISLQNLPGTNWQQSSWKLSESCLRTTCGGSTSLVVITLPGLSEPELTSG